MLKELEAVSLALGFAGAGLIFLSIIVEPGRVGPMFWAGICLAGVHYTFKAIQKLKNKNNNL